MKTSSEVSKPVCREFTIVETTRHSQVQSILYTCCMNNVLICTCYNQDRLNKMNLSSYECQIKIVYNISKLIHFIRYSIYG